MTDDLRVGSRQMASDVLGHSGALQRSTRRIDPMRSLDLGVGLALLIFFAPLLGCLTVALWLSGGGPAFRRRPFVGLGGADCVAYDFRSDGSSVAFWIRTAGLESLPRLFNLVNGELSLVGPRPLDTSDIRVYGKAFGDYSMVRPGMTGLWATRGIAESNLRARAVADQEYFAKKSWRMDLTILAQVLAAHLGLRPDA